MFYERYQALCRMRGVSPSGGADEMNLNRATVTFWKKDGFSPRQSTLEKLSSYFCVPMSFLTGETITPCPLCGGSGTSHEQHHRRYEAAVDKYGLCWNTALREKTLAHAAQTLGPALDGAQQIRLVGALVKAHFSYSLEQADYALSHLSFAQYRAALLAAPLWDDYLSPAVRRHLRPTVSDPQPRGAVYTLPQSLFTPPTPVPPAADTAAAPPCAPSVPPQPPRDTVERLRFTGVIPVLGRIAAGAPIVAEENVEEYIPTLLPNPDEYFALRIKGDSMIGAGIADGDTVLIHKQNTADHGQIVACLVNGEEATLKRFTVSDDTVLLLPENSRYQPIVVRAGDFESGKARILGVATEVTHHL